jgi:glycosyltransferase involved in cell wall biosynthesis
MRLYYWIHHTAVYDRGTGVQRVVRNLARALHEAGHDVVPVRWCADSECIVLAEAAHTTGLARHDGPDLGPTSQPGEPIHLSLDDRERLAGSWLLVPEVPHVAGEDAPNLAVALDYARYHRLRSAAVFHDLIPVRRSDYPELAAAHRDYGQALRATDVLLANSRHSADDLSAWWSELGYDTVSAPRVLAVPLPEEIRGVPRVTDSSEPDGRQIRFVTLGTVEPRKNQLRLMRAFSRLTHRRPDLDLQLDVIGGLHGAVEHEAREHGLLVGLFQVDVHDRLALRDLLRGGD